MSNIGGLSLAFSGRVVVIGGKQDFIGLEGHIESRHTTVSMSSAGPTWKYRVQLSNGKSEVFLHSELQKAPPQNF